jgi:putative flippase GtrA
MRPVAAVTESIDLKARAVRELRTATRFGLIGATATMIHVSMVWVLVAKTNAPVLLANLIAFALAFGVSFYGNYVWTFGRPGKPRRALARFVIIALLAFAANNALLALMLTFAWFSPSASAVSAAAVVPVVSFFGSRFWSFSNQTVPDGTNGYE